MTVQIIKIFVTVQEFIIFICENPNPKLQLLLYEHNSILYYVAKTLKFCKRSTQPIFRCISKIVKALHAYLKGNYVQYLTSTIDALETEWNGKVLMPGIKFMILNRLYLVKKRLNNVNGVDADTWASLIPAPFKYDKFSINDAITFFKEKESFWELRLMNEY